MRLHNINIKYDNYLVNQLKNIGLNYKMILEELN